MSSRGAIFFRLASASLLIIAACTGDQEPATNVDKRPTVALIMKSLANEFFVNMAQGAEQHHQQHLDQYDLIVNGLKDESDLTQQVALIEQMSARGVDIIVVAPADSKALIPAVARAVHNGIVVVNIDNKLDAGLLDDAGIAVPFVGPDNHEGAQLVGNYLGARLGKGDQVAIIGGISTAFNAQQRQAGFEDAMSAAGVEVVSIQAGNWDQGRASIVAAAMIAENPNIKALLCSNDNMAIGAIAAVRQAGKTGDIQVIGFDNIAATHELLRNGELLATVDQYGDQLAIFGIEYGLLILRDGEVPADRKTPVSLVTAGDL
ncbi:MAG: sugar ABC transporter substrate-binding protein [Proteobacteria bacterium]|nr:sugar ABC transporter substrate-binding protein [Pseudomonadota bacterium]